jgi:hypothetical protein
MTTTFKRFDEDDIVKANPTEVTMGLWTGDTGSLTLFRTSSAQAASVSGQYYINVYDVDPAVNTDAEVQFAIAYGHRTGGGATTLENDDSATLATKATYSQYRNLLLDPDDPQFTFAGNYNSDSIYIINIARSRLKERLDPGNWSLKIGGTTFIDDSGQTLGATFGKAGEVFNIVEGTLTGASGSTVVSTTAGGGGYGLVYPALGIIVLNGDALDAKVALGTVKTTTVNSKNHLKLLTAIQSGADFQARSAETVSSTHYFVRLRNKEFNYTNNPTFFNESNGAIENTDFIRDPRVYPTTVGLYNDDNELCAVAKLSKPVQKSFDKELLVRCRLDF